MSEIDVVGLEVVPGRYSIAVPATAATAVLQTGLVRLHGWSIANPGAAAAAVTIYNGGDATGQVAAGIQIPAGDSRALWLGDDGLVLDVSLAITTGAAGLIGALWVSRPPQ